MFGVIFGALSKFAASAIGKAVIGGAVSAVASNIGRKTVTPPPQVTTQRADLGAMREDAEKNGFNPLTVLRAGGLGVYGTQSTTMPSFTKQSFAGQFLGNMMMAGFDSWANQDSDRYNQQIRDLEIAQRTADLAYTKGLTGQMSAARYNAPAQVSGGMLEFGGSVTAVPPLSNIAVEALVPGTGKTLDEIFAQNPLDNRVSKTADGNYVNDTVGAALFPLVTPGGNTVYVPWNPEDSDIGAMVGGTLSYGMFSAFDFMREKSSSVRDWSQGVSEGIGRNTSNLGLFHP